MTPKIEKRFIFIGFGAVGRSLIELWNLEGKFMSNKITLIEPLNIEDMYFKGRKKMIHIKNELTKENIDILLDNMDKYTIVIDVSVNVDCLMIVKKCIESKANYINTSVEDWAHFDDEEKIYSNKYADFKHDTLYNRHKELDKLIKGSKNTMIFNLGQNPGMVDLYVQHALLKLAKEKNIEIGKGKYKYANIARKLKLKTIKITEIDTQRTYIEDDENTFYNTWSALGFMAEAVDEIMIGYGTDKKKSVFEDIIVPDDEPYPNVYFLPIRGMDKKEISYCVTPEGDPIIINGYLIPHAEANTISYFLTSEDHKYRPSVYYVYQPSEIAIRSLEHFKNNNYKPLEGWYVLEQDDIYEGYDSVGVLLEFEDGAKYWCGSSLTIDQVKEYGFKVSTATTLQVSTALNAGIDYMMKYRNKGGLDVEETNLEILENAKRYLGNFIFKKLKI